MSRGKIFLIVVVVVVVIIIAAYFLTRKPVSQETKNKLKDPLQPSIYPLGLGYKGEIVKDIQQKLNRIFPGVNLAVDGEIGNETAKHLKWAVGFPVTQKMYQDLTVMAS
jgi:hypothetical protein